MPNIDTDTATAIAPAPAPAYTVDAILPNAYTAVVAEHEARLNITYRRQNGDLPDPVSAAATDAEVIQWVTEAVRAGHVPGITADPDVDLSGFVVDRFGPNEARPYSLLQVRPKTPFGD